MILVSDVSHDYHEGKNFSFHELKLDMLIGLEVLLMNIIIQINKTLVFHK